MKKPVIILGGLLLMGGMIGCRSQQSHSATPVAIAQQPVGGSSKYLPGAMIYRTNGDYIDKVPVMLNADGTSLLSYPAPTDLSLESQPVKLSGGWLLDRRGVGPSSVFTTYTYKEYMALPQAPSPDEILAHVIPGSAVTALVELPVTMSQANSNPEICNSFIKSGFTGCKILAAPK